jgi:acyl dehydratase
MGDPPGASVVRRNRHRYADGMNWLYLDDLTVGQRFTSGTRTLNAAEMQRFAADHGPQPFHLDDAAARVTLFGGLVASGWHTACTMMRLIVDGGLRIAGGIIGTGGELLWTRPVRPGDTLHVECEVLEITPSRSKPDRGSVTVRCVTLNSTARWCRASPPELVVSRRPPVPSAPTGSR